jgi:hypothetical protein
MVLCPIPMSTDFITFRRLENLYVAMPAKPQAHFLGCAARRSLQDFFTASFSMHMPTKVSSLEEVIIDL